MTPIPPYATAARPGGPAGGKRRRPSPAIWARDVAVDLDAHRLRVGAPVLVGPPSELQLLAGLVRPVLARNELADA